MKILAIITSLTILITSCEIFENKEKKAIEICQKQKVQLLTDNIYAQLGLSIFGLSDNSNWLDYANMIARQDPTIKQNWSAKKTEEKNIYLVSFADEQGWGHRWEVDIEQQIVKHINTNEYLSRKYGLSRLDNDYNFEINDIKTDTIKLEKQHNYYSGNSRKLVYILKASITNNSEKILTSGSVSGKLQIIFKDKTIEGESNWESGFKTKISKSKPWNPGTKREFFIKTKGVEEIYLGYEPEYVFFTINLKVEDPIGFSFDKAIEEFDIKSKWATLRD